MKKIMVSLMVVFMLMVSTTAAFAAQPIRVFIDNTQIVFDVEPTIINGRTMVPLSSILNMLGLRYQWYAPEKKVYVYNENKICYELTIDSTSVDVRELIDNGSSNMRSMKELLGSYYRMDLDVPPVIINGRTLVPIRFMSEIAGYDISWDNVNKIATIHTDPEYYNPIPDITIYDNIATDMNGDILLVNDTVYDFAELYGNDYMVYARIVAIDEINNKVQLQWYDITMFQWFEDEIPYLNYFRYHPNDFSLLQRANGITFDSLQWYDAGSVFLYY